MSAPVPAPVQGPRSRRVLVVVVSTIVALSAVAAALYVAWPRGAPSPAAPAPPTNVRAEPGDGQVTVSWDAGSGAAAYHLYRASEPGVTKDNHAAKADGARHADVASPYTVSGLANGRTYYFRVTAASAAGESEESAEASATPEGAAVPLYVTGVVEFDTGARVVGAGVTARSESGTAAATGTTGPDGRFTLALTPAFPERVLVEVTQRRTGQPPVTGFRWSSIQNAGGAADVGRIVLPDPSNKALALQGSDASGADGRVLVSGLPPGIASMWARSYDPDRSPDAFPGDLAEGRERPLNSVAFLWIAALDAAGDPVVPVDPAATVRMAVPASQWGDLDDLLPGTGAIDIPIYSLDYDTGYWVREGDGVLTDSGGIVVPESAGVEILQGTYAGEVYAEFRADHFSWWNLDYPPKGCGTDFGDAPDPTYPSRLGSNGARHQNICRAWLGAWMDGESDAAVPDLDRFDNGLLDRDPVTLRVSNWNWSSDLYVNILVDGAADGDWSDEGDWVVQNLAASVWTGKGERVETDLTWAGDTWMRITLTGEPIPAYDGTGEFAIGETEDYISFVPPMSSLFVETLGNGTVTSSPAGIDCPAFSRCVAEFPPGEAVTLTATPDPGHSFILWTDDCRGRGATCGVVMDAERRANAMFTSWQYRLTVEWGWNQSDGNGTVTSDPPGIDCRLEGGAVSGTCEAMFLAGSVVTLTAVPDPGHVFLAWRGDCQGTSPTCTLTMDRDRWVSPYFGKP